MATIAFPIQAATKLQDAAGATGNGTALDVTGAGRVLFYAEGGGTTVTGGTVIFEASVDGGTTWSALTVRNVTGTDSGTALASSTWTASLASAIYKADHQDGPCQVRARIATTITGTGTPVVTVYAIPTGLAG